MRATGAAVAVKVIPAGAPEEVAAIQREIEMLKQCNHPNVVRYLARACACCPACNDLPRRIMSWQPAGQVQV